MGTTARRATTGRTAPTAAADIDYEALGLWDDGPCDPALEPLHIGLMTVFESPVLSLIDQALALEAAAEGFNARGGANGACIEVTTCDDGGNPEQAIGCVRTIDEAGVVATVNDQGSTAQGDVAEAMADAGIPRVAPNVTSDDWGDQNAFPLHASGTGLAFLLPQAMIDEGITEIGLIRVDLPEIDRAARLPGRACTRRRTSTPTRRSRQGPPTSASSSWRPRTWAPRAHARCSASRRRSRSPAPASSSAPTCRSAPAWAPSPTRR